MIEPDVMSDEDRVTHESLKGIGDLGEDRCIRNHLIANPGKSRDILRNGSLRINQALPAINDFAALHPNRTNLRHAMEWRPSASRFNIDNDVGLLGVDDPRDPVHSDIKTKLTKMRKLDQLIAT